jgi:hypothetical protein
LRAVVREITAGPQADPRWVPALIEFWTHASHDPGLRRDVASRHERNLDGPDPATFEETTLGFIARLTSQDPPDSGGTAPTTASDTDARSD